MFSPRGLVFHWSTDPSHRARPVPSANLRCRVGVLDRLRAADPLSRLLRAGGPQHGAARLRGEAAPPTPSGSIPRRRARCHALASSPARPSARIVDRSDESRQSWHGTSHDGTYSYSEQVVSHRFLRWGHRGLRSFRATTPVCIRRWSSMQMSSLRFEIGRPWVH